MTPQQLRPGVRPAAHPQDGAGPAALLFDRDGTLVEDVPYNGDPRLVRPLPGVRRALEHVRRQGLPTAVVTNQSGVGRGLITREQMLRVHARVDELLGPFDAWCVCPHTEDDGCACRKPLPGLVLDAARRLGVPPERCVLFGDIGSDVDAAVAAGARGVLVPTSRTLQKETAAAPQTAPDLHTAVRRVLSAGSGR
jgi:D-glycero-D-manno-heptose 1,7-bisphosphate phosphatase